MTVEIIPEKYPFLDMIMNTFFNIRKPYIYIIFILIILSLAFWILLPECLRCQGSGCSCTLSKLGLVYFKGGLN